MMNSPEWLSLEEEFAYYAGIVNTTYFLRDLLGVPMKEKIGDLTGIGEATTTLTEFWEKSGLKSFLTTLLDSAVKEIGLSFEDTNRQYRLNNLIKIGEKSSKKLKGRNIEVKSINKDFAIEWIEAASLVEDEYLQEIFAELLVSKVLAKSTRRDYINILSGLTQNDARILNSLFEFRKENNESEKVLSGEGLRQVLELSQFSTSDDEIQESADALIRKGLCQTGINHTGIIRSFSLEEGIDLTPDGTRFIKLVNPKNSLTL